jgi:hypothetical protein
MLGLNSPKSGRRFATIDDAFSSDSAYWGERNQWYIVAAQNRDSDTLDESNFAVLAKRLEGHCEIERANHWACGWVDYLIIAPNDKKALRIATEAQDAVEQYPILDETHFSQREWDKFHDYAEGELKGFDMWQVVLHEELDMSNSGPGDESAEYRIIEAARERLEAREAWIESGVGLAYPFDPAQMNLFTPDISGF